LAFIQTTLNTYRQYFDSILATNHSAQRLDLFSWCVKQSQLLVGFPTHLKSIHFHFISFHLYDSEFPV